MTAAKNAHVELKIFGEQGHGVQDTETYVDENTMVVNFFDKQLRPAR